MSLKNIIANYLLSKKESASIKKQFISWDQISTISIVMSANQIHDILEFVEACKKNSILIHAAIIYDGPIEKVPKPNFDYSIYTKKQFSLFQIPNEKTLKELNTSPFDVLINLCEPNQMQALALSKLIAAKCKISYFQNPIFDISIKMDKATDFSGFLKQVILYLNMIKTKK
jgi:hypothetical protein